MLLADVGLVDKARRYMTLLQATTSRLLYRDSGKEHGSYRDYRVFLEILWGLILGLYRDTGKENGNYYIVY